MRVLAGEFGEGTVVQGARSEERAAAAFSLLGQDAKKRAAAKAGDTVALGRLEKIYSGETLSVEKGGGTQIKAPEPPQPVYGVAIGVKDRKDEVKLTGRAARLMEEDPSLRLEHAKDTHQMVLWGQGEMHLRVALERLKRKYGVEAESKPRQLPYKETIRKGIEIRGRHKKQSGGHGQFGDVVLDIKPLPRGSGFQFDEKITGGVVPRQFIPSVEIGVSDYLQQRAAGRLSGGRRGGDADATARTTRSTPPTWPSARPAASAWPRACPSAARCCWSRSWRWRSPFPPRPRRASTA